MAAKYNGMKYARDWIGKEVVLAREVVNGAARHPAGLRGTIFSQSARGLDFECEPCACCGMRARITRLGYYDVMLTPNDKHEARLAVALDAPVGRGKD